MSIIIGTVYKYIGHCLIPLDPCTYTILENEIQERLKLLLIDANKSRFSYPTHHKTVIVQNSEFLVEPNIIRSIILVINKYSLIRHIHRPSRSVAKQKTNHCVKLSTLHGNKFHLVMHLGIFSILSIVMPLI